MRTFRILGIGDKIQLHDITCKQPTTLVCEWNANLPGGMPIERIQAEIAAHNCYTDEDQRPTHMDEGRFLRRRMPLAGTENPVNPYPIGSPNWHRYRKGEIHGHMISEESP